jgi:hypothetical protein
MHPIVVYQLVKTRMDQQREAEPPTRRRSPSSWPGTPVENKLSAKLKTLDEFSLQTQMGRPSARTASGPSTHPHITNVRPRGPQGPNRRSFQVAADLQPVTSGPAHYQDIATPTPTPLHRETVRQAAGGYPCRNR